MCIQFMATSAPHSFEPLISRVGQTIRRPLRIRIKYAANVQRAVRMPTHFECPYYYYSSTDKNYNLLGI